MGRMDRIGRASMGVLIAVLYFFNAITGPVAVVLGVIALIFLVTSFVGFCPIYHVAKKNTLPKPIEKFYIRPKSQNNLVKK